MKPTDLRGILRYIPQFRERVFVLGIDGAVVTHENFSNLLLDIAVLRSLNIGVILVHGASALIRQLADRAGEVPSDLDGAGRTNEVTLELALHAANRLTHEILEGLAANNLSGAATNAIIAHPRGILQGVDQQWTGRVERIDDKLLNSLLTQGIVPVVPPLGFDGEGRTYRLNSDHVACELALRLGAIKLIYLSTGEGLLRGGQLIRQIKVDHLEQLLKSARGEFSPESRSKAAYSAEACRAGVPRVHVINGLVDEGVLTEVFSNEGIGTLVYANEYQQIRPAMKKDVRSILALTKQAVAREELLKRTRQTIENHLRDYYIFEVDTNPVACIALHQYPATGQGEIANLYVGPSHENQGIGRKLVRFIEEKASELGLQQILVLSTQAYTYFQNKAGYLPGSIDDLPPERRAEYEHSPRRSRILIKQLNPKNPANTASPSAP